MLVIAIGLRDDGILRHYKYSWAAIGIGLLAITLFFGYEVNGARLWINLGPISVQPGELLKIVLVIFIAGYLAETRTLLTSARMRIGFISHPAAAVLPADAGLVRGGHAGRRPAQRPRHRAPLLRHLPDDAVRGDRAAQLRPHRPGPVRGRLVRRLPACSATSRRASTPGSIRSPIRWVPGFQPVRALYALGRGGVFGEGLGQGLVTLAGDPTIPFVQTDFIFTAVAEELGLLGAFALLGFAAVIVFRGLRIAVLARDDFSALLAVGLTASLGLQTLIIIGGNTKLMPLTGITLPFVSYGGSSMLASFIMIGLLLAISHRSVGRRPSERPAMIATNVRRLGAVLHAALRRRLGQRDLVAGHRGRIARRAARQPRGHRRAAHACCAGRSSMPRGRSLAPRQVIDGLSRAHVRRPGLHPPHRLLEPALRHAPAWSAPSRTSWSAGPIRTRSATSSATSWTASRSRAT